MNNIDKYIKFIKDYLTEYFKLIVKDKYKKIIILHFSTSFKWCNSWLFN